MKYNPISDDRLFELIRYLDTTPEIVIDVDRWHDLMSALYELKRLRYTLGKLQSHMDAPPHGTTTASLLMDVRRRLWALHAAQEQ